MASTVHLNLKYHNMDDESVTISSNLFGAKRIYKTMHHDQKEDESINLEINVTSLIKKFKDMVIQPPTRKAHHHIQMSRSGWFRGHQEQLPQI